MDHVFGYTIVNDVTARDVQMRHQQWDLGKSFDTFCPMGPWIVTADELDGRDTRVRCWVNGELRQDGRTTDLIFDIPTLIETCSRGITLHPGDVIATGTPAGVGMGFTRRAGCATATWCASRSTASAFQHLHAADAGAGRWHRVRAHRPAGQRPLAAAPMARCRSRRRSSTDAVLRGACATAGRVARARHRPLDGHHRLPAAGGAATRRWCAAWRCSAR
jgi:hypothetical protein